MVGAESLDLFVDSGNGKWKAREKITSMIGILKTSEVERVAFMPGAEKHSVCKRKSEKEDFDGARMTPL